MERLVLGGGVATEYGDFVGDAMTKKGQKFLKQTKELFSDLAIFSEADRIHILNEVRKLIHANSPFKDEPVDCIQWIPAEQVFANDYNPNTVAPPEMKLLEHSIIEDGYTQPIVAWSDGSRYEVIDGFHRNRVGKESPTVQKRTHGYLPITIANANRLDKGDRIAATIRHNRARGKHRIDAMSDIVVELKRRNWSTERICRELGMEEDEVLRLCQITGLAELFSDQEFSKSWDVEGEIREEDFRELSDDVATYGEETEEFRTVNTNDPNRIFHTYDQWECYKAGFYNTTKQGMTKEQCEEIYRELLTDTEAFASALHSVRVEWIKSCEHYLTNTAMNRIAWLGQAALCYAKNIPSTFRSGFHLLDATQQEAANRLALDCLNTWLIDHGKPAISLEEAYSGERQSDIY